MRKIYALSLLGMLSSFCAYAQDSVKVTVLREVAVSASRMPQALIDIPRSVSVIGSDVIERSAYTSLGDLLNEQSGIYVTGAGQTPGTNQNVFMRGASSNQVAVMVDGVRITDPSSPNSAIDLSEISLTNVDRVEIIRGSHSTMYGGAAIGGVINIITRKPSGEGLHGHASWQGSAFGKGGRGSAENATFSYSLKSGLYFSGSLFQQNVRGLDASEKPAASPSYSADRDGFRKSDGLATVGFRDEQWDASLSFKNIHQHTDIDNGAYSDDDNNYLVFDRRFFQYRGARKFGAHWRVTALGSLSASERFYENDSSKISDTAYDKLYSSGTYHGHLQTHEIQGAYSDERWQGVLGAGLYDESMSFDNYFFFNDPAFPYESRTNYDTIDTHTTTSYLFAQLGYHRGILQVSGGARVSHHSTAGTFVTFDFNPAIRIRNLLVYGSLSTGFNAPSLYQLYDPSRSFSAYTTRGNRGLEPERSVSLEAGVKHEFLSGTYFTLSAFEARVRNSIEYVYLWSGSVPLDELGFADDRGDTYINAGENLARGIELDGFVHISQKFSLQGNVTVLSTKVMVEPGDIDLRHTGGNHVQLYNLGSFLSDGLEQKHLVRRPDHTGFVRLGYRPLEDVRVTATYRYTGKHYDSGYDGQLGPYGALSRLAIEGYDLVDVGVEWHATKALFLTARVENILNEPFREVAGFRTRGRGFYVKALVKW